MPANLSDSLGATGAWWKSKVAAEEEFTQAATEAKKARLRFNLSRAQLDLEKAEEAEGTEIDADQVNLLEAQVHRVGLIRNLFESPHSQPA